MGNNVADFGSGLKAGWRDRIEKTITGTDYNIYTTTTPPSPQPSDRRFAAGRSTRCIDYNHPEFYRYVRLRRVSPHSRWRPNVGHPFSKESVSLSMPSHINVTDGFRYTEGVFAPTQGYAEAMRLLGTEGKFPSFPEGLGYTRQTLQALGATAIAKSIPDIPDFSLFRFVGELKAGLPKVPLALLTKEKKLRNVGGEYLNVQFGILPLVSDLQNFMEALQNPALRTAVKRQLNSEFRVRKLIDKGTETTHRIPTGLEMSTVVGLRDLTGIVSTEKSYRVWSSCSFVYHQVSMLDRLLDDLDNKLGGLGALPTAIDIWNLTPWSWLIDWFSNVNHVITNLSYLGKDGLYLQRGYIMAHCTEKETSRTTGTIHRRGPYTTTGVRTFDRKYRVRASPFGFGVTVADLNPFQVSILGALGVSRMRF